MFKQTFDRIEVDQSVEIGSIDIFKSLDYNTAPFRIGWIVYDHERMNHLFPLYTDSLNGSRFLILQSHLLVYPEIHAAIPSNTDRDGVIQKYYAEADLLSGRCRLYTYSKLNMNVLRKVISTQNQIRTLKIDDFSGYKLAIPNDVVGPIMDNYDRVLWRYEGPVIPPLNIALEKWGSESATMPTVQSLLDIPQNMDLGDFMYVFVANGRQLRLLYKRRGGWRLNAAFSVPHDLEGVECDGEIAPSQMDTIYKYVRLTSDNTATIKTTWDILRIHYYI